MRESYNHPNVAALNVFDISPEVMTQIYQIIQYSPVICSSFSPELSLSFHNNISGPKPPI